MITFLSPLRNLLSPETHGFSSWATLKADVDRLHSLAPETSEQAQNAIEGRSYGGAAPIEIGNGTLNLGLLLVENDSVRLEAWFGSSENREGRIRGIAARSHEDAVVFANSVLRELSAIDDQGTAYIVTVRKASGLTQRPVPPSPVQCPSWACFDASTIWARRSPSLGKLCSFRISWQVARPATRVE